jgi:hypothetical protein
MKCVRGNAIRACQSKGEDWKLLAAECGVSADGPVPIGPLRKIGAKSWTCARLYRATENPNLPLDDQMREFLLAIGATTGTGSYRGQMMDAVFAVVHLLRRFPETCVEVDLREPLDWDHFSIVWENGQLSATEIVLSHANDCLQRNRFFFSLLTLKGPWTVDSHTGRLTQTLHANALAYDRETGIMERFEPYQAHVTWLETQKLDVALENAFHALPGYKRFVGPPEVCLVSREGLQWQAEKQERPKGVQYCLAWSMLYVELRFRFPDMDPEALPELVALWAREKNVLLSSMARAYTRNLENLKLEAYAKILSDPGHNLLAVVADMIKESKQPRRP